LGATLAIAGCLLFSAVLLPTFGGGSRDTQAYYAALETAMTDTGVPPKDVGPIITDFPIWLADTTGARSLALPEEPPTDVLDLARHFGATTVVVSGDAGGGRLWPDVVETSNAGVGCFEEIHLPSANPASAVGLNETRVFRIVCR
jgi:hypothetical protein